MGNRNGRLREQQQPLASDAAYANQGPAAGVVALFSDVPRVLLVLSVVLLLILIFAIASLAVLVQTKNECAHQSSISCGAGGKDVSGLSGSDLPFSRDSSDGVVLTNYWLRVCGAVELSPSSPCYGQLPDNSQAYLADGNNCINFASYAAGVGRWLSTGASLTYYNSYGGSACSGGAGFYSLVVTFVCNAGVANGYISTVTTSQCEVNFYVQTRDAC